MTDAARVVYMEAEILMMMRRRRREVAEMEAMEKFACVNVLRGFNFKVSSNGWQERKWGVHFITLKANLGGYMHSDYKEQFYR